MNEGRTQLEIMDIKLSEILHKSIDDASKHEMVKLTVTFIIIYLSKRVQ